MDFNFDIKSRFDTEYLEYNSAKWKDVQVWTYKDNTKCEIRYNGGEFAVYYNKFSEDAQNAIHNESFPTLKKAMEHIICDVPRTKKKDKQDKKELTTILMSLKWDCGFLDIPNTPKNNKAISLINKGLKILK
jgi:seryl-tRNA synthetase